MVLPSKIPCDPEQPGCARAIGPATKAFQVQQGLCERFCRQVEHGLLIPGGVEPEPSRNRASVSAVERVESVSVLARISKKLRIAALHH